MVRSRSRKRLCDADFSLRSPSILEESLTCFLSKIKIISPLGAVTSHYFQLTISLMSELKISGFPEFLPNAQAVENFLKNRIAKRFELYGYANIETPVVERNEVLLAKSTEELSKQIFGLYGLAQ